MKSMKKIFESSTKTRINIIGPSKSGKSTLAMNLIKDGIFNFKDIDNEDNNTIFSTEILCCGNRENKVRMHLELKNKEEIIKELRNSILNFIDEAFLKIICEPSNNTFNDKNIKRNKFFSIFNNEMKDHFEIPLLRFFNKDNLRQVFAYVNFDVLFDELNTEKDEDELLGLDNFIWNKYFSEFMADVCDKYEDWLKEIDKYYVRKDSDEGTVYVNLSDNQYQSFENDDLNSIMKILYDNKSCCALMIKRAYIEAPCRENEYSNIVFIDYVNESFDNNLVKNIEMRVGKDYKELFLVVVPCKDKFDYLLKIKNGINKVTLDKRIFCIINKFDEYKNSLIKNNEPIPNNVINTIKEDVVNKLRITRDKVIVTERFNDIDKKTLKMLSSNSDFTRLIKMIKSCSLKLSKTIKVRNPSEKNVISISLNQERMSVQALMTMLYERYNGHLVGVWRDVISNASNIKNENKKYYNNACRSIIRNRKHDFRGYKYKVNKLNQNEEKTIDFSLRSGDRNDAKKILKMLVNYGYHTIGFNSNENKILVKVNGEISNEDKKVLIDSIKGRLEESAITYFENAFFRDISNKKFNATNLEEALMDERNITIDDFYSAFEEIFNTMSINIQRYEVLIQEV